MEELIKKIEDAQAKFLAENPQAAEEFISTMGKRTDSYITYIAERFDIDMSEKEEKPKKKYKKKPTKKTKKKK